MNAAENVMETQLGTHLGDRLHLFIEHDLAPAEEAEVLEHLSACGTCADEHARLEHTVAALRSVGRASAPVGFAARVLRRVRVARRRAHPLGQSLANKVPFEGGIIILIAAATAAAVLAWQVVGDEVRSETPTVQQPR